MSGEEGGAEGEIPKVSLAKDRTTFLKRETANLIAKAAKIAERTNGPINEHPVPPVIPSGITAEQYAQEGPTGIPIGHFEAGFPSEYSHRTPLFESPKLDMYLAGLPGVDETHPDRIEWTVFSHIVEAERTDIEDQQRKLFPDKDTFDDPDSPAAIEFIIVLERAEMIKKLLENIQQGELISEQFNDKPLLYKYLLIQRKRWELKAETAAEDSDEKAEAEKNIGIFNAFWGKLEKLDTIETPSLQEQHSKDKQHIKEEKKLGKLAKKLGGRLLGKIEQHGPTGTDLN